MCRSACLALFPPSSPCGHTLPLSPSQPHSPRFTGLSASPVPRLKGFGLGEEPWSCSSPCPGGLWSSLLSPPLFLLSIPPFRCPPRAVFSSHAGLKLQQLGWDWISGKTSLLGQQGSGIGARGSCGLSIAGGVQEEPLVGDDLARALLWLLVFGGCFMGLGGNSPHPAMCQGVFLILSQWHWVWAAARAGDCAWGMPSAPAGTQNPEAPG